MREPAVSRQQDHMARASSSLVGGAITLVVVMLALLAFEDITTDESAAFLPEYGMLAVAGAWSLFVAYSLMTAGHRLVGAISMVAVAAAVWVACDGLGHQRDGGWSAFWREYTVMLTTALWFVSLSVVLFTPGRRGLKRASH